LGLSTAGAGRGVYDDDQADVIQLPPGSDEDYEDNSKEEATHSSTAILTTPFGLCFPDWPQFVISVQCGEQTHHLLFIDVS